MLQRRDCDAYTQREARPGQRPAAAHPDDAARTGRVQPARQQRAHAGRPRRSILDEALNIAKYYKRTPAAASPSPALPPDLPPLFGVRDQLVQVFLNLVLNAIDATDRDGRIELMSQRQRGGRRGRRVRDNGGGIAAGARGPAVPAVFHDEEARHRPGPVRDAQAGRGPRRHRRLASRSPARARLFASACHWPTCRPQCGAGRADDQAAVPRESAPMVRAARRTGSTSSRSSRRPLATILVVDDEPLIRDTLAEYLTGGLRRSPPAASGEERWRWPREQRFDVALCDVQLPGMDGLELLDRLQQSAPKRSCCSSPPTPRWRTPWRRFSAAPTIT